MSADKKSSHVLISLALAAASVLGVFAIIDASSAKASPGVAQPSSDNLQPIISVSPSELQASLFPAELLTQTLRISNEGDSELTFDVYETTPTLKSSTWLVAPAAIPLIEPEVQAKVSTAGEASVIVYLREIPNLSLSDLISDKQARRVYVYQRLRETAQHSADLYQWLTLQGAEPRRLLLANAIAARLNPAQLSQLAENPQVKEITLDHTITISPSEQPVMIGPLPPAQKVQPDAEPDWNISKIRADEAWEAFGVTGEGAVVGILDTGVMYDHAALVNSYRGNLGGGTFDHNYNWYDFINYQHIPYDDNGHGTMGAGIVSGDGGSGFQIGVAPGANWIAVKVLSGGGGYNETDLLAGLEWMLAPTDLNFAHPDPTKAADIVLGMWGGWGCDNNFKSVIQVLRAANILPVFSPGGNGPACGSITSPAAMSETLAAGATDQNDLIASFSSRGPGCNGVVKPDVSAPGVEIRTSNLGGCYVTVSGVSWSTAHAAGAAAMIVSANPWLGVDDVTGILETTAVCIDNFGQCGQATCPGPNNVYGHGRIDIYEAVRVASGTPPAHGEIAWLSEAPLSGTVSAGETISVEVTYDTTGLEAGTYEGAVVVASNDPTNPYFSVPVTLEVVEPCEPVNVNQVGYTPSNPKVGEPVTFTVMATGTPPITYAWHFGDGLDGEGEVVTHVYAKADIYQLDLIASNACGTHHVIFIVTVEPLRNLLPLINR